MESENARDIMKASIAQSVEQAVQDATDTLRNISTMETTVIGVASAKWLADPVNVAYKEIIDNAKESIQFAVSNLSAVGEASAKILQELDV